jgi:hypothetical protein
LVDGDAPGLVARDDIICEVFVALDHVGVAVGCEMLAPGGRQRS